MTHGRASGISRASARKHSYAEAGEARQGRGGREATPPRPFAALPRAPRHSGAHRVGVRYVDEERSPPGREVRTGDALAVALAAARGSDSVDDLQRAWLGRVADPRAGPTARWRAKRGSTATGSGRRGADGGRPEGGRRVRGFLKTRTRTAGQLRAARGDRLPESKDDLGFCSTGSATTAACYAGERRAPSSVPTPPIQKGGPGIGPEMATVARAWLDRSGGSFVWSRFARGWCRRSDRARRGGRPPRRARYGAPRGRGGVEGITRALGATEIIESVRHLRLEETDEGASLRGKVVEARSAPRSSRHRGRICRRGAHRHCETEAGGVSTRLPFHLVGGADLQRSRPRGRRASSARRSRRPACARRRARRRRRTSRTGACGRRGADLAALLAHVRASGPTSCVGKGPAPTRVL